MDRLCEILLDWYNNSRSWYNINLAELYREQQRFTEAEKMISTVNNQDTGVTSKLISKLIREKQPALIRYRM
jgi:hypothetical protein